MMITTGRRFLILSSSREALFVVEAGTAEQAILRAEQVRHLVETVEPGVTFIAEEWNEQTPLPNFLNGFFASGSEAKRLTH